MARVTVRVLNKTRDSVLGARVEIADTWRARLRGFIRRPPPAEGEGLLLSPCRGVHTWWVRFALDVILVDRHGRVVAMYEDLEPGHRTRYHLAAEYALELPAGTIAATGTQLNDLLAWLPANPGHPSADASTSAIEAVGVETADDDPVVHVSRLEIKAASQP